MTRSKIFSLLLLSFIGGVFLFSFFRPNHLMAIGIAASGSAILAIACIKKDHSKFQGRVVLGFLILMMALGFWRGAEFLGRSEGAEAVGTVSKEENLIGIVSEEPDRRLDFSQYAVKTKTFGEVLIRAEIYPEYQYGDILKISGKIEKPPSELPDSQFDYSNYLAKSGIFFVSYHPKISLAGRPENKNFYGHLLEFKKSFVGNINRLFPEPQASFLSALLLGAKRSLPEDLTESFNKTGTSHVIAISGYNISIISIMLFNILGFFLIPRKASFWIVGACLLIFTLVSGASASVVRAAIMGGLLIIAKREGRLYQITNAVIFTGALMIFINPYLLRYDIGFQLSFLATLGLVYLSPLFEKWFFRITDFMSFRSNLAATLSAQIVTLPVIFWNFGRISLIAPLANILILPAIPSAMFFGFASGILGFISLKMAMILAAPTWILLSYQIWIVKILSLVPGASL